jgi:hypothetical protein
VRTASRVHDRGLLAVGRDRPVQQLRQDEQFRRTRLEALHVHAAGAQHHRVRLDAGHPSHRDEDPPPVHQFDHQAQDARRLVVGAQRGHRVANAAELITVRVEDTQSGQSRDEDPGAHVGRLVAQSRNT